MQRTIFLFSLLVLIIVAGIAFWNSRTSVALPPQDLMGVLRPEPKSLTSFELVDHNKESFIRERLLGKWTLLFYGYTHCPDVCPMTLSVLTTIYNKLDEETGERTGAQILFVSVDPERDTPEKLADYMSFFNEEFLAVTGKKADIDSFSQQFGAGYILEQEASPGEYLVSHTSAIFLVDPMARLVASFSQPHDAETILAQYRKIRAYINSTLPKGASE